MHRKISSAGLAGVFLPLAEACREDRRDRDGSWVAFDFAVAPRPGVDSGSFNPADPMIESAGIGSREWVARMGGAIVFTLH
jgi:hypothetical protein